MKRMSLVNQIRCLFGLLIALFCVVSAYSLRQQSHLDVIATRLHDEMAPYEALMGKTLTALYRARMLVLNSLTTTDPQRTENYVKQATESLGVIEAAFEKIQKDPAFVGQKEKLSPALTEYNTYKAIVVDVLAMAKKGDIEAAKKAVDERCFPQFEKLKGALIPITFSS